MTNRVPSHQWSDDGSDFYTCLRCGNHTYQYDEAGVWWSACSGREATVMSCVFHANCATGEGRKAARSTREDRAMRQHRWAYSNTNEAWFCEVCHRQDRSGQDVPDDDPCPGKKEPRDA